MTNGIMEATTMLVACGVLLGVSLGAVIVSKTTRPSLTMFSLYFLTILVIPGIVHTAENRFPFYRKFYAPETLMTSAAIVLAFVTIVLAVYFLARPRVSPPADSAPYRLSWGFAYILLGAAGLATIAAAERAGFDTLLSSRLEFEMTSGLSGFDVVLFVSSARILAFCALTYAGLVLVRAPKRFLSWLLFLPALGIFLIANYPLALPRFYSVGFALAWFALAGGLISRKGRVALIVGSAAAVSVVLPFLAVVTRGANTDIGWSHYFASGDFDSLQSVNNAVQFVEQNGPTLGQQMVSVALFFVPRSVWPGKAEATGSMVARFANYSYLNISAPLPAELYTDFHWPGVIVGAILAGLAMRWFDAWVAANWHANPRARLWAAVITGFSFIVLRGSLLAIAAPIAYVAFGFWLITHFGVKNRQEVGGMM